MESTVFKAWNVIRVQFNRKKIRYEIDLFVETIVLNGVFSYKLLEASWGGGVLFLYNSAEK